MEDGGPIGGLSIRFHVNGLFISTGPTYLNNYLNSMCTKAGWHEINVLETFLERIHFSPL